MIKIRLIRLLDHAVKHVAAQVLWKWIALIVQIVMIFTAAKLIGDVYLMKAGIRDLFYAVLIFIAGIAVRFLCDRKISTASYHASADVKRILRESIYEKLLRLGSAYREQTATSAVIQMASEGVDQLEVYFGSYLSQLAYSLLAPVTLFAVLAFTDLTASVILLLFVPLIPLSIVVVQKIAKRLLNRYWSIYEGLGDSFLENLQGMTTLKIYQADEEKAEEMDRESENFRKITMKVLTMQLNSTSVMDIMAYGGAAVGMVTALSRFQAGGIDLCGTLRIILLAAEFFLPLRRLGSYFHVAMNGMAASDRIFALLDLEEPEMIGEQLEDGPVPIVIEDLSFSYDGERRILDHVGLEIPSGRLTSLAGASGCGKSTIVSILSGKQKHYEGSIRIQGQELRDISEASLLSHITVVAHDSYIFKGTVADNLRIGKPTLSVREMEDVLQRVNLLAFVNSQNGLDTVIAEGGSNLSGGQRQRLALARALLHDTPVYLFDEATSNIDLESEAMIMDVVRSLAETKTVLLISHRLANVVESKRIYMMKDGRIDSYGTHKSLLAKKGLYREMYMEQKELESYGKKKRRSSK